MFDQPNITDIPSLFDYANIATSGWFWQFMLLTIYIITYMTLSTRTDSKRAFAVSGFFVGILAVLMRVLSLITDVPLIISIVMALVGFIGLLFSDTSSI